MSTAWYRFDAADVWFFRDGRPFNQGDPAQRAIESLFPPHPATAVGALRAALARGLGWEGHGRWKKTITETLGDGENLNGRISFQGPYLVRGPFGPVFPAPAALARDPDEDGRIRRLSPGRRRQCDLGCVRLPVPPVESPKVKALFGSWLTKSGMQSFLNGSAPDKRHVYGRDAEGDDIAQTLFDREVRIGLARNAVTRVAEQGALYTAGFVRPRTKEKIALVLGVRGENLPSPVSPIPFGGEGRFAWVESTNEIDMPKPPTTFHRHTSQNGEMLLYTVTLITPAKLPDPWPVAGKSLAGLPGTIVCACHERPLMVGGWASQAVNGMKMGPQPLRAMLPPGSTWFMEADPSDEAAVRGRHGTHIGEKQDWGNCSRGWRYEAFCACAGGANLTQRMSDSAISIPPEREREGCAADRAGGVD